MRTKVGAVRLVSAMTTILVDFILPKLEVDLKRADDLEKAMRCLTTSRIAFIKATLLNFKVESEEEIESFGNMLRGFDLVSTGYILEKLEEEE